MDLSAYKTGGFVKIHNQIRFIKICKELLETARLYILKRNRKIKDLHDIWEIQPKLQSSAWHTASFISLDMWFRW